MLIILLLLCGAVLRADPVTFTFSGSWGPNMLNEGMPSIAIQPGDPFSGSFTFERDQDGIAVGALSFAIDGLAFETFLFEENHYGWGLVGGKTAEPLCLNVSRNVFGYCTVILAFIGPPRGTDSGNGTANHLASLWTYDVDGKWLSGLAGSSNVSIDPYLPFGISEAYFIPEPATLILLGSALLILGWKIHHHRVVKSE